MRQVLPVVPAKLLNADLKNISAIPGLVEAVRVVTHNDDFKLIANHYKCLPLPKVILVEQ
jgi:hypothetical protein